VYKLRVELVGFSAAHRVVEAYHGKCNHLHGHYYSVWVTVSAKTLNPAGMLIDFSDVRGACNQWLLQHFDHATLVVPSDTALLHFLRTDQQKHYVLDAVNTTAECLAKHLFYIFESLLPSDITLNSVEVFESPRAGAVFEKS
jgi:6-pyruvoyltetrahydropterin/6-carboxytetrahydropterin synthase